MNTARKAFTLIELLVVIAIIAILAAILFPVFAQAKIAAKKTVYISNQKQSGTAIQVYLGDYDDTWPLAYMQRPPSEGAGTWGIGLLTPTPADSVTSPPWNTAPRIAQAQTYWANAIQPYSKNYGLFNCPVAPILVVNGGPGGTPDLYNLTQIQPALGMNYNGFFHSLPASSVVAPANAVAMWIGQKLNIKSRTFSTPALNCNGNMDVNGNPVPCQFNPGGDPRGGALANPGGNDLFFVFDFVQTAWTFDKKMVASKADSSTKVVPVGTVVTPLVSTPAGGLVDPYAQVGTTGVPFSYWRCGALGPTDGNINGQYACYFRPDRVQ